MPGPHGLLRGRWSQGGPGIWCGCRHFSFLLFPAARAPAVELSTPALRQSAVCAVFVGSGMTAELGVVGKSPGAAARVRRGPGARQACLGQQKLVVTRSCRSLVRARQWQDSNLCEACRRIWLPLSQLFNILRVKGSADLPPRAELSQSGLSH